MALLDMLFNPTPPQAMSGLLGEDQMNQLRSQATRTGLVNAVIGYLAQPKNQRFGSALPYIARGIMAGQAGAQGVYDDALRNYQLQQKIEEANREKAARAEFDAAKANLYKTSPAQYQETVSPGGYAPSQSEIQPGQVAPNFGLTRLPDVTQRVMTAPEQQVLNPQALQQAIFSGDPRANQLLTGIKTLRELSSQPERKTAVVGKTLVDTSTGQVVYEAPTEAKARQTREVDAGNKILIVDASTGETVREISKGQAPRAPREVSYSVQTDANGNAVYVPNVPGAPVLDITGKPTTYKPAPTAAEAKVQEKQAQAKKLPILIAEAEKYITEATGSYLGAGADIAARTFGVSTPGAQNIARLKGIEANLVLNMPRLEGPQSNLDQQLYREAAGQIGDPTVPAETKLAALETIKTINTKYGADGVQNKEQAEPQAQQPKPIPKVGEERNGYIFKGGNPNDPKSWIKKGK